MVRRSARTRVSRECTHFRVWFRQPGAASFSRPLILPPLERAGRVARLWFPSIVRDGRQRLDTTHHRKSRSRRADPHDIIAVLPGLIDEIGPSLHQLPPQRQRIATPVVTFDTRHHVTKRCVGDFALYTVIAAPVPEG